VTSQENQWQTKKIDDNGKQSRKASEHKETAARQTANKAQHERLFSFSYFFKKTKITLCVSRNYKVYYAKPN
jgi:hypothetical protein